VTLFPDIRDHSGSNNIEARRSKLRRMARWRIQATGSVWFVGSDNGQPKPGCPDEKAADETFQAKITLESIFSSKMDKNNN
jgi:hypothetical protein